MNNIVVDLDELDNEVEAEPEPPKVEEPKEEPKAKSRYDDWDRDTAIKNYQELEKLQSRHAQEVGYLRKQMEDLSRRAVEQQPEKIDVDSLLEDPDNAVQRSISNNPRVRELDEKLTRIQQMEAVNMLKNTHPDSEDVVHTPDYQNWVVESPIRRELHAKANNYDYDAANYLLSTFKERQKYAKTERAKEDADVKRREDLKAATSGGASSGSVSQKIYRRHDLQRLNQNDPEKYDAMLPEIIKAYQEGRVK